MLARATGADPLGLLDLLHSRPEVFDSLWYACWPPKRPGAADGGGGFDVDSVLGRG